MPLVDLSTAIQDLFGDIQTVAQTIAPIAAIIGFIGLGVMYMGSSWPLIGDWKRDNPKAANQVVIGLLFVVFASSVTALITFS
jgi:phage-related minor tail protein